MNVITLFAAAVLAHNIFGGGSGSSGNLSASVEYTSVNRSGDIMTVRLSSGDPYYGRDYFYYGDRHYYRYTPAYVVIDPPCPWHWHPKKKKRHPHDYRWVEVVRYDERRLPVTTYVLAQPEREIVRFEDVRRAPERYVYASYSSGKSDSIATYRSVEADRDFQPSAKPSPKVRLNLADSQKSRAPRGGPKAETRGKPDQSKNKPRMNDKPGGGPKIETRGNRAKTDRSKGKASGDTRLGLRPSEKRGSGRMQESRPTRAGSKPDKDGRGSGGGKSDKGSRGKGRG